ncbi:branched-chain amino acid ABC transporter permease [Ornithinimicrobium ciconiae]|uniref:Branched-chain amino acid ABC transporter permease n=1 Tax=Ornithinimicrobium ciconiae TaxID=2594265 RepID=A0A516G8Z5_9MICO|nr:branched-chain amino acid ABC transporter permease [Ornithinimicrobium ciconiae]QDO88003.1 branched-chain amino acid ABC transporter permease [Ornithinimicrobium ciconiae]
MMQVVANGVALGAILFLMAAGLSLLLGAMGVLNLAHGAVYMIGAYVTWMLTVDQGLSLVLAVLAAGAVCGVVGLGLERLFRIIPGKPNEQILLSFGLIYVLANVAQWIWGPVAKAPFQVSWLEGALTIGNVSIPTARLAIAAVGFALAVLLWVVQDRTRVGAIVRAGMDDAEMTRSLGINLDRVVVAVFVLGSAVAGIAGGMGGLVLGASSSQPMDVLLLALVVVVVGGVGSVPGTLVAAVVIGLLDAFSRHQFPEMASVVLYLLMALVLMIRPSGLSGRTA